MSLKSLKKLFVPTLLALLFSFNAYAESDETLAIRRIATCYHEKDFELSQRLIDDFIQSYPASTHFENLYLLLADGYLQKKEWGKALATYQLIRDPDLEEQSMLQRLHCHYSLKNFHAIEKIIQPKLTKLTNFSKADQNLITFYYAESLLKEDLKSLTNNSLSTTLSLYSKLLKTSLEPYAKVGMAHIYALQNKHTIASQYFTESAQNFPEMKEKLLFAAASAQSHFDQILASETFHQIKELNTFSHQEAFYNWMILLYHSDNFEKIIQSKEELLSQVPASKLADTHFVLGKTFFKQKQFITALNHFDKCIETQTANDQIQEVALLGLLTSYQINDQNKLNSYFTILEKKFKSSKEYPEALFWKAKLFQNNKEYTKALALYNKVIKLRCRKLTPAATYQIGLIYFLQNQFQKSQDTFSKFLQSFPDSAYSKPSLSYLLQSCFKLLQQKETPKVKQQLIDAHITALKADDYFEEDQRPGVYLSIAKLHLDLGQQKEFLDSLNTLLTHFPKHERCYQAHLLLAYNAKKKKKNLDLYLSHLENAILSRPPESVLTPIYADLFHGYLQNAKKHESMQLVFEKASMCALKLVDAQYDVSQNLYLWFSQSYFQELEKRVHLASSCIPLDEGIQILGYYLKKFPETSSTTEKNIRFNYATILGWQKKYTSKLQVLETLQKELDTESALYVKSLLEIALCHEDLDQKDKAIETYEKLISKENFSILDISLKAKLKLARLLTSSYFKSNSDELLTKINMLYRDLHMTRSLDTEPLHLEAALDSTLFTHLNSTSAHQLAPYLEALIKLKEDFLNKDTLLTQEYHEMRSKDPEKNKLFEAYMMLIDARILNLQVSCEVFSEYGLIKAKSALAQNLLLRLQKEKPTPYLEKMVEVDSQLFIDDSFSPDMLSSYLLEGLTNEL